MPRIRRFGVYGRALTARYAVARLAIGGCHRSPGRPPRVDIAAPSGIAVVCADDRLDVPANVEVPHDLAVSGGEQPDEVVKHDVDDILVIDVAIAEAVDVQLHRLQLDAPWPRHVADVQRGEIGEARDRAEACEFGDGELDRVIAIG